MQKGKEVLCVRIYGQLQQQQERHWTKVNARGCRSGWTLSTQQGGGRGGQGAGVGGQGGGVGGQGVGGSEL